MWRKCTSNGRSMLFVVAHPKTVAGAWNPHGSPLFFPISRAHCVLCCGVVWKTEMRRGTRNISNVYRRAMHWNFSSGWKTSGGFANVFHHIELIDFTFFTLVYVCCGKCVYTLFSVADINLTFYQTSFLAAAASSSFYSSIQFFLHVDLLYSLIFSQIYDIVIFALNLNRLLDENIFQIWISDKIKIINRFSLKKLSKKFTQNQ